MSVITYHASSKGRAVAPKPDAPPTAVVHIRNWEEYSAFKTANPRAVVFYGAEWCEACHTIEDLYERIARRYKKYVALAHVDIDECGLDFSSVPVFVSLFEGRQLRSVVGADKDELKAMIKHVIVVKAHLQDSQDAADTEPVTDGAA